MPARRSLGHLYHVEDAVLQKPGLNVSSFSPISPVHHNTRLAEIDPALYTHVYHLLGSNPLRFTKDLSLYMATVQTFFDRQTQSDLIQIPIGADADSKKRISEDMGVALASTFMAAAFDISWDTISQIPANSKLSSKRPDFQSYRHGDKSKPYLFEAKGTTALSSIATATAKAVEQVKGYPVSAHEKLVLISFLSADSRYFPSTTFVIDPPALTSDYIDPGISSLLHFEKILQFSGFARTSSLYLRLLSKLLKDGKAGISSIDEASYRNRLEARALRESFDEESRDLQTRSVDNREVLGQRVATEGGTVFFGADTERMEQGLRFVPLEKEYEQIHIVDGSTMRSKLGDGSFFEFRRKVQV